MSKKNTNSHKPFTNFSSIFLSFCECLGTFSRFPYAKDFFKPFYSFS